MFHNVHADSVVVIDPWRKMTSNLLSTEIIHYGDSRKTDEFQSVTAYTDLENQVLAIWPGLVDRKNLIHVIDALMTSESSFLLRPTELIVGEMLEAKKNGKTKFFFHCLAETFLKTVVFKLHRIAKIVEQEIPTSDIFYLVGASDAQQSYDNYASERGYEKRINILQIGRAHV